MLLVRHIFPLVERLSKLDKFRGPYISSETWEKIRELEELSVDELSSQLAKKLAHHSGLFGRLTPEKIASLVASTPEKLDITENLIERGLICPACKNKTLSAFQDYDVDVEDGSVLAAYCIPSMRCRVCSLALDESEIRKKLVRDLAKIDGVLTALGHSARDAFEKGRKKYAHSAKARQAISRAQKARWRKLKKARNPAT